MKSTLRGEKEDEGQKESDREGDPCSKVAMFSVSLAGDSFVRGWPCLVVLAMNWPGDRKRGKERQEYRIVDKVMRVTKTIHRICVRGK